MYTHHLSTGTPSRRPRALVASVVGVATVASLLLGTPATAGLPVPAAQLAGTQLATAPRVEPTSTTPDDYVPPMGPMFNNPLNAEHSRDISRHIRRTIASVPKGSKIRIFSWNIKSRVFENALIGAHNRGVSVRVLMSNGIAEGQDDQGSYHRLRHELLQHQLSRRPEMKSWARTCINSCRGQYGAAHSKFFLFSQVGQLPTALPDVVMVGSPNLTQAAALHQWNELITFSNRPTLYQAFLDVFNEASRDTPVSPAFKEMAEGDMTAWFTPVGTTRDPVLGILDQVKCQGAAEGTGVNGATRVRIAADAMVGARGLKIAERIRTLRNWGCNIRLQYSLIGKQIGKTLFDPHGKGPVPAQHYVQDLDGDGAYDNYLHIKSIAVSGHWGDETAAHIVLNGSNNWSAFGAASDDAGLIIDRATVEAKYANWMDRLWESKPPYSGDSSVSLRSSNGSLTGLLGGWLDGGAAGGWGPDHEVLTSENAWKYRNILD